MMARAGCAPIWPKARSVCWPAEIAPADVHVVGLTATSPDELTGEEAELYTRVTEYVREEFNKADQGDDGRKVTVGFALLIVQRRLASSPEAIRFYCQAFGIKRVVLHGVGEPMLVRNLPRMVRYLKDRGTYVLFNTNGTLLNERNGRALIEAGLDELRVSLDASNAKSFLAVRGKDYFGRILKNVRAFRNLQEREGKDRPRVSACIAARSASASSCRR